MKNSKSHRTALLGASLSIAALVAPAAAQDQVTAITNAKIMSVGPAGTIDKGTILIKGGKITAVGANVTVPQEPP